MSYTIDVCLSVRLSNPCICLSVYLSSALLHECVLIVTDLTILTFSSLSNLSSSFSQTDSVGDRTVAEGRSDSHPTQARHSDRSFEKQLEH